VPGYWNEKTGTGKGLAWLRLKILLNDVNKKNFGLYLNYAFTEYQLYINGKEKMRNGKTGLETVCKHAPDIILIDLMMPVMDGFKIAKLLKENPDTKDIPLLFVTARSDIEERIQGLKLGAIDYVCKPFVIEELIAKIESLLTIFTVEIKS
jgi:DNA-binding response OmpR family regulator